MVKITEAFKAEFTSILMLNKPANEVLQGAMGFLKEHAMIYSIKAESKFFLVHKDNRGGLMLSPHNVHRNAANICKVGADLKQLTNAVCMELPGNGPLREAHLSANKSLIARSNDLLAPINGEERYCTLGCGHTCAFAKLASCPEGGITNQEAISVEGSNRIFVQKLKENQDFKTMLEEGWTWTVVKAEIDIEFPEFAKVAQKALNTANHVGSSVSELEAMVTLADSLVSLAEVDKDFEKLAVKSIQDLCVPCSSYAVVLKNFVKQFAGGPGAPLIHFLDAVANQFQCHVVLGSAFWTALTDIKLGDKVDQRPFSRIALALCNLQCAEIEDGIARLVTPAHIKKLSANSGFTKCSELEKDLKQAWDIVQTITSTLAKPEDIFYQALGQFFVRAALNAIGKSYDGLNNEDIKVCFLECLSATAGQTIDFPAWQRASAPAVDATPKAHMPVALAVQSLDDLANPVFIMEKQGFNIGMQVQLDGSSMYYEIVSISSKIGIRRIGVYNALEQFESSVELPEFLQTFVKPKQAAPQQMAQTIVPIIPQTQVTKAALFKALAEAYGKHCQKASDLVLWSNPYQVRTSCKIGSEKLVLVPMASLTNIFQASAPIINSIEFPEKHASDVGLSTFRITKPAFKPTDPYYIPFWFVNQTQVSADINMVAGTRVFGGVTVPVLINMREIPAFTQLCKKADAPDAAKAAPKPAPAVQADPSAAKAAPAAKSAPAKKKARKSN